MVVTWGRFHASLYNVDDAKLQGNHKHGLLNALTMVWTPLSTSLKHYDFRPYPMHADYSKDGYRGGLRLAWKVDPSSWGSRGLQYVMLCLWFEPQINSILHHSHHRIPSFAWEEDLRMWSLVGLWVRWPLGIELWGEVASTSSVLLLISWVQLSSSSLN